MWTPRSSGSVCSPATTAATGSGATRCSSEAGARLHRWRSAAALPAGPDAADLIGRLREYLADDLDTPRALAAVDGWCTDALEYGGHDPSSPAAVAAAVDALLGVPL